MGNRLVQRASTIQRPFCIGSAINSAVLAIAFFCIHVEDVVGSIGRPQEMQMILISTGNLKAGADIFQPQDVHGAIKLAAGNAQSVSVVLDSPAVAIQLSPASAEVLYGLAMIFSKLQSPSEQPPINRTGQASKLDSFQEKGQEDLRCGLFERTQVAASRPGISIQSCREITYFL